MIASLEFQRVREALLVCNDTDRALPTPLDSALGRRPRQRGSKASMGHSVAPPRPNSPQASRRLGQTLGTEKVRESSHVYRCQSN